MGGSSVDPDAVADAAGKHVLLALGIGLAALVVGGGTGWLVDLGLGFLGRVAPSLRALACLVPARTAALGLAANAMFLLYFDGEVGKAREPSVALVAFMAMSPLAFVLVASHAGATRTSARSVPWLASATRNVLFVCALVAAFVDSMYGYRGLAYLARESHARTFSLEESRGHILLIALLYLPVDLGLGAVTALFLWLRGRSGPAAPGA